MKRPYVFCHMLISMDGKIMGNYMDTPQGIKAGDIFYDIAFGKKSYYHHQGWLSGRVTTDDNFTFYKKPQLDENAPQVPEGDYIADDQAKMYYVSIDPKGRLGWEDSTLVYEDTKAHVIEILTDKASNAYKALLRKLHISYMIVGEDAIDFEVMLEKLKENAYAHLGFSAHDASITYENGHCVMSRPTITALSGNGFGLTATYTVSFPISWGGKTFADLQVPITVTSYYRFK